MDETIPNSPLWDQMPYYPQATCGFENPYQEGFYNSTLIPHQTSFSPNFTTVTPPNEQTILSPEISSSAGNSGEKSPKPIIAKPAMRRRSRAPRKTPTTLLNASISNFRAVVQQYTGCRPSPTSFKNHGGPIILSFGPSGDRNQSLEDSIGRYYSDQDPYQEQELQYPKAELQQEEGQQQQCRVSYDNGFHDSFSSGVDNSHSSSMLSVDDYEW